MPGSFADPARVGVPHREIADFTGQNKLSAGLAMVTTLGFNLLRSQRSPRYLQVPCSPVTDFEHPLAAGHSACALIYGTDKLVFHVGPTQLHVEPARRRAPVKGWAPRSKTERRSD